MSIYSDTLVKEGKHSVTKICKACSESFSSGSKVWKDSVKTTKFYSTCGLCKDLRWSTAPSSFFFSYWCAKIWNRDAIIFVRLNFFDLHTFDGFILCWFSYPMVKKAEVQLSSLILSRQEIGSTVWCTLFLANIHLHFTQSKFALQTFDFVYFPFFGKIMLAKNTLSTLILLGFKLCSTIKW